MPFSLSLEKLYTSYSNACVEIAVNPVSTEEFACQISKGLYYLLSAMVEERTPLLSLTFKINDDISCFIAPFSGGRICLIFDSKEEIKKEREKYAKLTEDQQKSSPTELF